MSGLSATGCRIISAARSTRRWASGKATPRPNTGQSWRRRCGEAIGLLAAHYRKTAAIIEASTEWPSATAKAAE